MHLLQTIKEQSALYYSSSHKKVHDQSVADGVCHDKIWRHRFDIRRSGSQRRRRCAQLL